MAALYSFCYWSLLLLYLLILKPSPSKAGPFRIIRRRPSYRKALEVQVDVTNRQLRRSNEEAVQLRNQIKLLSQKYRKASTEERRQLKTQQNFLKGQVEKLNVHVRELETLRAELEELLRLEQAKVKNLEAQNHEMELRYEQEIQTLRETLLAESKEKLEQLQTVMDRRVSDAIRQNREQMESENKVKLERAIEKERQKAAQALQQAMEKERAKLKSLELALISARTASDETKRRMRKLVKALATKERKLIAEAEQSQQNAAKTSSTLSSSSSSKTRVGAAVISPIKK